MVPSRLFTEQYIATTAGIGIPGPLRQPPGPINPASPRPPTRAAVHAQRLPAPRPGTLRARLLPLFATIYSGYLAPDSLRSSYANRWYWGKASKVGPDG